MWLNTRFSSPVKPLVLVKNKKHSNVIRKYSRYDFFFGNRSKDQLSRSAGQAFKQANGQEKIESILSSSRIRNNRFSLFCCDFLSIVEHRCNQEWVSIHFLKLKEPLDEDGSRVRWVGVCSWEWLRSVCDICHLKVEYKVSSDSNSEHMIFKRTHEGEYW